MLIELNKHLKVVKPEAKAMFPYSYSLLIEDEITAMIDAGAGGKAYAATPAANIQLLFLTHHHFDHINGVSLFNNAQVIAGQEELWAYRDEAQFLISLGSQRWPELMGGTLEEGREQVSRLPNSLPDDIPSRQRFNPIEVKDVLADGNVYKLGQTSLRAIHTPGHSPGHYSFFFPNEEILFTGDLDVSRRGPWYGSETCNLDDLVQSVNKLIVLKPKILISSHRGIVDTNIEESLKNYIDIALQREEKIKQYLAEPRTIDDIVSQNFFTEWEFKTQLSLFHQKMMILKHLNRLEKLGMIVKNTGGKYVRIG